MQDVGQGVGGPKARIQGGLSFSKGVQTVSRRLGNAGTETRLLLQLLMCQSVVYRDDQTGGTEDGQR